MEKALPPAFAMLFLLPLEDITCQTYAKVTLVNCAAGDTCATVPVGWTASGENKLRLVAG